MRMRSWAVGLLAVPLALVTFSGTSLAAEDPDPSPPPTTNIVGGQPASETYSFMVSLQNFSGSHSCGGSLVSSTWVTTAAHCGTPTQVRVGTTNRTSGGEVARVAERRVLGGDMALLRLATPVQSQPIPIADSAPIGSPTRLLGWGQTCPRRGCGRPPITLQQLDTSILADSRCGGIRGSYELCINGGGGRGACYGDSGGPAIIGTSGNWQLVGATSRGTAGTCAVSPAIYEDVTYFKSQIERIIGGTAARAG